ncbi:MAG: hypothetical protein DCO96_12500 [Fluviicola sp. XM-24bin1]|nr:MAG: hypothetical protein DCO96_12500 [Fluviicola sp. XM-24bin1]
MKRLAFILILPLAFACKTQKNAAEEAAEPTTQPGNGSIEITTNTEEDGTVEATEDSNSKPQKPYRTKAKLGEVARKSDYYEIASAKIEGTLLLMTINYSGGCAAHEFEFIGSPGVSKSLPPQRSVILVHDNGEDMCEGWVQREIEIDITEMAYKQERGSEIILNLQGYDEPLKFVFP